MLSGILVIEISCIDSNFFTLSFQKLLKGFLSQFSCRGKRSTTSFWWFLTSHNLLLNTKEDCEMSKRHFRPRCQILNVYEVLLCFLEKYSSGPVMHFTCVVFVNTLYDFNTECYLTIAVIFFFYPITYIITAYFTGSFVIHWRASSSWTPLCVWLKCVNAGDWHCDSNTRWICSWEGK